MRAQKTDIQADALHTGKAQKGEVGVSDWRDVLLGNVADIQTGPFGSQLHSSDYVAEGIPSIMPTNIGTRLNINKREIACIKESDAKRLDRYLVQDGDVVYSRRGDVEKCAYITRNEDGWLCGTGCLRIRFVGETVFPKFCAYYLSTDEMKGLILGSAVGTTMPNLNSSILRKLPLSLPPLPEQRAIASVLSCLDDKIDLLNRQNKTLESMAETLFRQWFIEAPAQPSPRPSPSGSGGKDTGVVADLIEFNPQRALRKGTIATYLEMASLSNTTFAPESWYEREFSSGTKFTNGDTLLARITPCLENGKAAHITFLREGEVAWGSTEYIVMRPKKGLHPFFAYTLARNSDFKDYAEGCLEGSSGRQRVNVDHLRNYSMSMPEQSTVDKFNAIADSIVPKLHSNSRQVRSLTKLRDTLLPKLMSGEVEVGE